MIENYIFKMLVDCYVIFCHCTAILTASGEQSTCAGGHRHTQKQQSTGAACHGHNKKEKTKQINNHPVRRPLVMAHGRKQEKTHSSCAAACHGRK